MIGAIALVVVNVFALPWAIWKPFVSPASISACSVLPASALERVFPSGAVRSGDGPVCSVGPAGQAGGRPRLEVTLIGDGIVGAVRAHEDGLRRDAAEHVVRPVSSVGDAAYSWVSIESLGVFNAEVNGRMGGHRLRVSIWGPAAVSAADAEALAVSVAGAVARQVR
ncbi:hypothetical protein [Actinomadura sp. 9N407]|uniref:hypothetical protein n=1 Tax=Actinomadura sp. 9N407 TaxID=3375154 RepID=UPI00379AFE79